MNQPLGLRIENDIAILEFDQPDSKVNVLSAAVLSELKELLSQLAKRQDLNGLCITSLKPDIFIAGADIKEIEKINSAPDAQAKSQAGQEILNALEKLPFPVIALINGACLGGGLELALACDYRLACFGERIKLGLPEVKLGIIPGFGGTKRLSRLVGLHKGLQMILSGEVISSNDALRIGLVDGLCSQDRLLEEGIDFLKRERLKRKQFKPRLKGLVNIYLDRSSLGRAILFFQARKFVFKTTKGQYPAALRAIEVVVKNYSLPLGEALRNEARVFGELAIGSVSKNLISVFYIIEKYKKARWVEASAGQISKCAILGAGVMGAGIAQLFSSCGLPVRMKDLNYQALGRGLKQAKEVYDYALKKRRLKANQASFGLGLISPTTTYSGFSNADLIVEAAAEDLKIKKSIFAELSPLARPDAVLASNTSCLSISEMSEVVKDKGRLIGMHFFNPVHRMPLIELIRTPYTSDEAVATLVEFSKKIGKVPIVVKDSCGFLINRILLPYLDEAGFILEEGVGIDKIDEVMLDFGMPLGPFTLMDEIGLDIGYKVALLLEEHFGERMRVPEILKKVYQKKWFGKKSARGFYLHQGKNKTPNRQVYNLFSGRIRLDMSEADILNRMIYRMINEAACCLGERICSEHSDVDIGTIMGIGFPAFRGGLLHYADSLGWDKIRDGLQEFQGRFKTERYAPCNYLLELARTKGSLEK